MVNFDQLRSDEGVKYEIYSDHLGYSTFGIGHLITENDPEFGLPIGTPVSPQRVQEVFLADCEKMLIECKKLYTDWDSFPISVKEILHNMMFNLGRPRLSQFVKFNAALSARNWKEAAKEGLNSRWAKQVPNRATRLMNRLASV
jgi:lysozyme